MVAWESHCTESSVARGMETIELERPPYRLARRHASSKILVRSVDVGCNYGVLRCLLRLASTGVPTREMVQAREGIRSVQVMLEAGTDDGFRVASATPAKKPAIWIAWGAHLPLLFISVPKAGDRMLLCIYILLSSLIFNHTLFCTFRHDQ